MNDISFEVDFNDKDKDGHVKASMRYASGGRTPVVGETVWVADDEGNRCRGTVASVDGVVIHIDLDRSTWRVLGPSTAPVAVEGRVEGGTVVIRGTVTERVLVPQLV